MIALADLAATQALGRALGRSLVAGDAVALVGDLGVGKTALVDACVRELGGEGATSPTFSLVNELRLPRLRVWHLDLYRVERQAELVELGLDDILGDRRGVAFVEWADRWDVMPAEHLRLELAHGADAGRIAAIHGVGARGAALAQAVLAAVRT